VDTRFGDLNIYFVIKLFGGVSDTPIENEYGKENVADHLEFVTRVML
jgi:hypothetical protein